MSYHIPNTTTLLSEDPEHSGSSNAGDEDDESSDDDQNWDDWVSDSIRKAGCKSLFDDKTLQNAEEAMSYDKETHGFDLSDTCDKLKLDVYGRIRYVRFNTVTCSLWRLTDGECVFIYLGKG